MNSTESATAARDRLSKQRTYRRVMFGFIAVGVAVALVLRELLGYPLVGEAVYWIAIAGFLATWRLAPVALFDERDRALERRASQLTLFVLVPVLVVGGAAARVLPRVTAVEVPAAVWPALYAYISVFVVFGVVYAVLRYRP